MAEVSFHGVEPEAATNNFLQTSEHFDRFFSPRTLTNCAFLTKLMSPSSSF